jgi:hypothetical protein
MRPLIRSANSEDYEWVMAQAEEFDKFFDAKFSLVPDKEEAAILFKALIDSHLFLISEINGVRTGFITGLISPHFLNSNVNTLTEILWWVDTKYRLGRSGVTLLNAFVEWGKENVQMINFSLEDKSPINDSTLERRGFRYKERAFIMECV